VVTDRKQPQATGGPGDPDEALTARIIQQNLALHEATANLYDLSHPELRHAFERHLLRQDLDLIAELLRGVPQPLAVDVGAGTGRLALQFAARGWDCLAVDSSPAMLAVLQRRYQRLRGPKGHVQTLVCAAGDFTDDLLDGRAVHLAGFSSVLHHLPDYLGVLGRFCDLLAPGGVLYLTQEPLPASVTRKTVSLRLLKLLDQALRAPQQLHRAVVKARLRVDVPAETDLVDYHDRGGLDIDRLRATLGQHGLVVRRERAYKDRKTALMAWLDTNLLRTPNWRFRLLAQKAE
jgi:SAM-dependent methyltransferase